MIDPAKTVEMLFSILRQYKDGKLTEWEAISEIADYVLLVHEMADKEEKSHLN